MSELSLCTDNAPALLGDRDDPIAEIVARKVIEIGASGVGDPAEISKCVIEQLGVRTPPLV
ncbi:hypothetical protein [Bradyrhizobium sp. CCBAU 51753]|uniref:hypothetical protein n=1 Tax=Bradyrhizobium sp. CCBAU 51753 TaxID=1325100 RepID=UPI001889DF01|nr:hypothetical protein [Bradyrhizobium sp. CCBAU 51753]QOZ24189.1 hypothetical protein XH93_11865 [Bradyrhizobium sp. CCBAU 51753]